MRSPHRAPHLDLGLALLVMAWLGSACGALPPQGATPGASPSNAPGASPAAHGPPAQDFERTVVKSHKGNWFLEADRAVFDRQVDEGRVYNIVWTLLDREGRPRLVAQAREAKVDAREEQVFFLGQVVARGSRGEVLVANSMHYDGKARRLHGRGGVTWSRPDAVVTGDEITATTPDFDRVELKGNVRVRLKQLPRGRAGP